MTISEHITYITRIHVYLQLCVGFIIAEFRWKTIVKHLK